MGSDSNVITITIYPHKHCGQAVNFSKSELHKKRKWSPRPTTRGGVPAPVPNPAGSCVANAMTCSFLHITAPERGGGSVRGLSAERKPLIFDVGPWSRRSMVISALLHPSICCIVVILCTFVFVCRMICKKARKKKRTKFVFRIYVYVVYFLLHLWGRLPSFLRRN